MSMMQMSSPMTHSGDHALNTPSPQRVCTSSPLSQTPHPRPRTATMKADTDGAVKPLQRWSVREEPVSRYCRGLWEFLGVDESQSETQLQLQMSFQTPTPDLDH